MDKLREDINNITQRQLMGAKSAIEHPGDNVENLANTLIKAKENYADRKNDFTALKANAVNQQKRVVKIGERLQAAFGGVSANMSKQLKKNGFGNELKNVGFFIRDVNSSFENLTMRNKAGVALVFGYSGMDTSMLFAPPAMCSFSREKKDEITTQSGINADVVEEYAIPPFEITMQGLLIDMNTHSFPKAKIKQLCSLFEFPGFWEVESDIFLSHNITTVYWRGITSSGVPGYEDTWQFTLKGLGVRPAEITMKTFV